MCPFWYKLSRLNLKTSCNLTELLNSTLLDHRFTTRPVRTLDHDCKLLKKWCRPRLIQTYTRTELLTLQGAASAEPRHHRATSMWDTPIPTVLHMKAGLNLQKHTFLSPCTKRFFMISNTERCRRSLAAERVKRQTVKWQKPRERNDAPSVHIKQMAVVWSELMLYCGAISILST